ncbi:MAG: DUF2062 domain-containing protein [Pseudomonadota bacterium]
MPKRLLKRLLPHHSTIREHKHLRHLGERLHDPNLWHLNRRSVSTATAVGLFVCYLPIPMQMVIAALLAVWLRTNLVIAVSLAFVSNPFTMAPMFYAAYKLGTFILRQPEQELNFELSLEWLTHGLAAVWQPFLLGSFLMGSLLALTGYIAVRLIWRVSVIHKWRTRHAGKR